MGYSPWGRREWDTTERLAPIFIARCGFSRCGGRAPEIWGHGLKRATLISECL